MYVKGGIIIGINVFMVVVTLTYVTLTYGIFKSTKDMNDTQTRLILAFESIQLNHNVQDKKIDYAEISIVLKNVGHVIGTYNVKYMNITIGNYDEIKIK